MYVPMSLPTNVAFINADDNAEGGLSSGRSFGGSGERGTAASMALGKRDDPILAYKIQKICQSLQNSCFHSQCGWLSVTDMKQ